MKKQYLAAAGVVAVLGRILLCSSVLTTILGYTTPNIHMISERLASIVAIAPRWTLYGLLLWILLASLSIVLGYQARIGAIALVVFLGLTTYLFDGFTFWNMVTEQARQEHIAHLVLNLSLMGAMLLIAANGSGPMSLDARRR